MTDKTLDNILASHRAFGDKLRQHFETHAAGGGLSPSAALQDSEESLARLNQQLDTAIRARQNALDRYDQEIEGIKRHIAARGQEIRERKDAVVLAAPVAAATKVKAPPPRKR